MRIRALTLFPEMFSCLNSSILGRAMAAGIIDFKAVNIRDYSQDKHFKCDDLPYGGGAGMVMTPQPVVSAIRAVDPLREAVRIYLSPKGEVFGTQLAKELSKEKNLVLLCGHYEGIDQRALELEIDREISIGDYVLTGGELPAMVLIDSVCRFIPGVLGSGDSAFDESFSITGSGAVNQEEAGGMLLEYPHYTRPQSFEGLEVPEVLLSGHHEKIAQWRRDKALEITALKRPDLLKKS